MDYNVELGKKLAKAVTTSNEWYSLRSLLGYSNMIFYIMVGAREAGKSFAVLDFFLHEFFTKGKDFVWLRLTEAATRKLLAHNAMQFIDIDLMRKYNINSTDLTVKGTTVFYKGKKMARILALSTFYTDKGVAHFEDKELENEMFAYNIALDEFNSERGERRTFDICYSFVGQLENLVRHKTNCRIFLIANDVQDSASDILTLFGFIPERFGRYKLHKKRAVIDYTPPSVKYVQRRKQAIATMLMPDAAAFTNKRNFDYGRIYKGRLRSPQYIIQFYNHKFTVWDNNIIVRYNNENKPIVAMIPLMIDNSVFRSDLRDQVVLMDYQKQFKFRDLMTQKLFDKCIKEVKGVK